MANHIYKEWIKLGLKKGISEIEIFAVTSKALQLSVYQKQTDQFVISDVESIKIKGIYDGKAATISTESMAEQSIDDLLDRLIDAAKNTTADEPAIIFAGSKSYPKLDIKLFDFDKVEFDKKKQLLLDLEDKVLQNELCIQVQATQYREVAGKTVLVNSKNLSLSKEYAYAYAYAVGIFKKDDDIKAAFEVCPAKKFSDFHVDEMARKIIDKGVSSVGGSSVKSGNYKTVFSKETFSDLIAVFSSIFSGEMAFRNVSPLKEKVGLKIAIDSFNLIDDPLNMQAFMQNSFDDEGVACYTKPVIENGVFKGFLHNLKTAAIFNQEPTGNGFGGSISPSNMYLKPGEVSFEDILKSVGTGIYITSLEGLHAGVNQTSGDFSLQASGFRIKDGKIGDPVKMIVVSGNLFTILNQIEAIGSDLEFFVSGFGSPTVYAGELGIAGEGSE